MIGTTVSHYRVLQQLGAGGMGIVYLAEDERLHRKVALKFLPPAIAADTHARARFTREAQSASALDHPNIATIYEIGEWDGQPFIAMAYYEGETLGQRLDHGSLSLKDVAGVLGDIAAGLEAAHAAGIVHRDLKPANIILTRNGPAKILDFGLAKMMSVDQATATRMTGRGLPWGRWRIWRRSRRRGGRWTNGRTCGRWCDPVRNADGAVAVPGGERGSDAPGDHHGEAGPGERPSSRRAARAGARGDGGTAAGAEGADDHGVRRGTGGGGVSGAGVVGDAGRGDGTDAVGVGETGARGDSGGARAGGAPLSRRVGWNRNAKTRWAHDVAIPEIKRLADQEQYLPAFALAQTAEQNIAGDRALAAAWEIVSRPATIDTQPQGAEVYYKSYAADDSVPWTHLGTSPIKGSRIPLGVLRFKIEKGGWATVEDAWPPFVSAGLVRAR